MPAKVLEQHIAVFGESGSGKTVMLSSFYGSEQEQHNVKKGAHNLVAEDPGQGVRLHQNYLGMRNSATVPDADKLKATSYRFLLQFRGDSDAGALRARPFEALRLVWHDYPGEWFEQDVSGPEEAQRRVATFRALLSSHVAMVLVDGRKLLDYKGEEELYLKSLLSNLRNSLLLLGDDLLEDGKPLVVFPRIWVIALSKADLLPDLDVRAFQELVIEKVGAEIVGLRGVLSGLVESAAALSIGEDFVLTSSAKFSAESIEVNQRIGLDLILPISAVLPLERHLRWAKTGKLGRKVAAELMANAEVVAAALGVASNLLATLVAKQNKVGKIAALAVTQLAPSLQDAIRNAAARFDAASEDAATRERNLAATLVRFRDDLNAAEAGGVLLRSPG